MSPRLVRKNAKVLHALTTLSLALITWVALRAMPFYPTWLQLVLALGVGGLALLSPQIATLVFVGLVSVPLIAADFVIGVAFLLLGFVATQYLSDEWAGAFIFTAAAIIAMPLHAEWAFVAAGGYLIGRNRGVLAAVTACFLAVAAGIALGAPALGSIATGAGAPLLSLGKVPENALTFAWFIPAMKAADPDELYVALSTMVKPALVALQMGLWALAALLGGAFQRDLKRRWLSLGAVAAGVVVVAAGSMALQRAFGGPVPSSTLATTFVVSLPLALALSAIGAFIFPLQVESLTLRTAPAPQRDVDELLRTIAAAEDELAARHNTEAVVLITDMKSFSAMTEEIGSVESAKIVQRHRDLLLPIIAAHKGKGAPTGGDGLVACFAKPADAVGAAIQMQQALHGYTGSDRSPHELAVRVGIASGEVVVDAAGCPFLGAALNLAARIMDLADGGRIMVTGGVAAASGMPMEALISHGEFKLKNIAEAVPVAEVLWREDMGAQEIRAS